MGDKLRDSAQGIISLQDYCSIMFKGNGTAQPNNKKDEKDAVNSFDNNHSEIENNISPPQHAKGVVNITIPFPWFY